MTDLAIQSLTLVRSPQYLDLTTRQWAMLGLLCDTPGPHSVKALSTMLGVQKPVITRMHTRMRTLKLVHRVVSARDRRQVSIEPTEKGRRLREILRSLP